MDGVRRLPETARDAWSGDRERVRGAWERYDDNVRVAEDLVEGASTVFAAGGALATLRKGGACFEGSTPVLTTEGWLPIVSVREGDLVWARDEATGEEGWRRVVRTYVRADESVLKVVVGGDDAEEIVVTAEHPFWVEGRGWVLAGGLVVGDEVATASGTRAFVLEVRRAPGRTVVYNLEVEGFHTYFVGEGGVWVHNKGGWWGPRGAAAAPRLASDVDRLARFATNVPTESGGMLNVVTHADAHSAWVRRNGSWIKVDHRSLARYIEALPSYNGQPVRLLACEAGSCATGLAQNLANKLGVPVEAASSKVLVYPDGSFSATGWTTFTPGAPR